MSKSLYHGFGLDSRPDRVTYGAGVGLPLSTLVSVLGGVGGGESAAVSC